MALKEVGRILDAPEGRVADALRRRLEELDGEMDALREQQRVITGLLKSGHVAAGPTVMDKAMWVSLLASSGFTEDDMTRWHVEFERSSPEEHGQFLRFLGIPDDEAKGIRRRSRTVELQSAKKGGARRA